MTGRTPYSFPITEYTYTYDQTARAIFDDYKITIAVRPSRGGMIALDDAEAIDFEFLNLDPIDPPPLKRLEDQIAEVVFCQRLLLLGAKWWDSEKRYLEVEDLKCASERNGMRSHPYELQIETTPSTLREKRFVKVGWLLSAGFWVAEFDTISDGVDEEILMLGQHSALRLKLARTMDERCAALRDRFNAAFYSSVGVCHGVGTFIRSWETKKTGEVGPLLFADERDSRKRREIKKLSPYCRPYRRITCLGWFLEVPSATPRLYEFVSHWSISIRVDSLEPLDSSSRSGFEAACWNSPLSRNSESLEWPHGVRRSPLLDVQ